MPFKKLLEGLVARTRAEGAVFLDPDGEAVQLVARGNTERLRLRAAYLGVLIVSARSCANRIGANMISLTVNFDGAVYVVGEISNGYVLVVELQPRSNVAEAAFKLKDAIGVLRAEVEP